MPNNDPKQTKVTPEVLLRSAEAQTLQKADEQASSLAGGFVAELIKAGHIKSIQAAHEAFEVGRKSLTESRQAVLLAVAMKGIEAYLPSEATQ